MSIKSDFERDGVVVLRGLIPQDDVRAWQLAYSAWAPEHRKVQWNKVAVEGPFPEPLASMYKHQAIVETACLIWGPDVALYNFRFVVKDKHSRDAVFLHQDTPYHVGWPNKCSIFVALSTVNDNGRMIFERGTYKFGYLGDAGEIGALSRAGRWAPTLVEGDVVVMHSAIWHESRAYEKGPDRILADIIVQPADDPSGRELLAGEWRCVPQPWLHEGNLFKRSRVSRIKELEAQVAK